MANIASAEKQWRQSEKAKARNRAGKSRLRGILKRNREVIEGGEAKAVETSLSESFSEIDRAARKKLIKENTANRYKSRLAAAAKRSAAAAK